MALSVSGKDAQAMLLWAFENNERCPLDGVNKNICKNIETILHGSHKTYKYILITQLLEVYVIKLLFPLKENF